MNNEALSVGELVNIFFRNFKVILTGFLLGMLLVIISIFSVPENYRIKVPLSIKGYIDEGLVKHFQERMDEVVQDPEYKQWIARELKIEPKKLGRDFISLEFVRSPGKVDFTLNGTDRALLQGKALPIAEEFIKRFPDKLEKWTDRVLASQFDRKKVFEKIYQDEVGKSSLRKELRKLNHIRGKKSAVSDKLHLLKRDLWLSQIELIQIQEDIKNAEEFFNAGVPKGPLKGVPRFSRLDGSRKSAIEKKIYTDLAREISSNRLKERSAAKLIALYKSEILNLKKEMAQSQAEEEALSDKVDSIRDHQQVMEGKTDFLEEKILSFKEFKLIRIEYNPNNRIQVNKQSNNKLASGAGMAVLLLMAIIFLVYFWELLLKPRWSVKR